SHALRMRDAAAWYGRGRQRLAGGDAAGAIPALRRATAIDRDNPAYRLALASALSTAGQTDSARELLMTVRDRAPEDATVNLQLARLEARRGDPASATRYYQNALYGVWPGEASEDRR